ncbi:hypothetical protein [Escherichia coli]|uniref:hypothetical protein n=1 Tax=Escherichia coli TaxID=562 RepID=UPI002022F8BE|nr:hypothetical protein [Escherichia coli]
MDAYRDELPVLLRVPEDDEEQRGAASVQTGATVIAAADIAATGMKVSDHLTAGGGCDRCRRSAGVGSNGCRW